MMAIIVLFCLTFAAASSFPDGFQSRKDKIQNDIMAIGNSGTVFGVSSMAGVTSNNGKMSSIGGVKFFHPPGASVIKDGDTMTFKYPIDGDKGMTAGFVKMGPGSVIASTSTYSGMPHNIDWKMDNSAFDLIPNWPLLDDFMFRPQLDIFGRPNYMGPWFTKHTLERFAPPKPDLRNSWPYPNLDPFLWR